MWKAFWASSGSIPGPLIIRFDQWEKTGSQDCVAEAYEQKHSQQMVLDGLIMSLINLIQECGKPSLDLGEASMSNTEELFEHSCVCRLWSSSDEETDCESARFIYSVACHQPVDIAQTLHLRDEHYESSWQDYFRVLAGDRLDLGYLIHFLLLLFSVNFNLLINKVEISIDYNNL